jgi:Na+-driven multidrug efflux pump
MVFFNDCCRFFIFFTSGIIPKIFSSNIEVIDYGKRYLKICAFILPAYPLFFLTNGFFMALKKSELALINNIVRNVMIPILVFYIAKKINANFDTFFLIWVLFQWSVSVGLLIIVNFYLKNRLNKFSTVINPGP